MITFQYSFQSIHPNVKLPNKIEKYKKRDFNDTNLSSFKEQLSLLHWYHIDINKDANQIYKSFLETFSDIYNANFPIKEFSMKGKDIQSPWISRGIKNHLKRNKKDMQNL